MRKHSVEQRGEPAGNSAKTAVKNSVKMMRVDENMFMLFMSKGEKTKVKIEKLR